MLLLCVVSGLRPGGCGHIFAISWYSCVRVPRYDFRISSMVVLVLDAGADARVGGCGRRVVPPPSLPLPGHGAGLTRTENQERCERAR